jgi:hypothetical protein
MEENAYEHKEFITSYPRRKEPDQTDQYTSVYIILNSDLN